MASRLNNLDVLRGLAALSVMAFHLRHATAPDSPMPQAAEAGFLGVDLFFVISGLVIPYSIWSLEQRYGAGWWREYAWRRFLRIYPLYALTCLVFIFFSNQQLLAHQPEYIAAQIATHLLLVQNFFALTNGGLHHVTWSIAIEAQFYLAVALLWPYLRLAPAWLVLVLGVAITLSWEQAGLAFFPNEPNLMNWLPGRFHEFAAGYFLFRFATDPHMPRERLKPLWLSSLILGAALYASWTAHLIDPANPAAVLVTGWQFAFGGWTFKLLFALGAALMVFGAIQASETIVSRVLGFFGTISYGVYLWHTLMISGFKSNGWTGEALCIGVAVSTIIVATLSYYFFERMYLIAAHRVAPAASLQRQPIIQATAIGE